MQNRDFMKAWIDRVPMIPSLILCLDIGRSIRIQPISYLIGAMSLLKIGILVEELYTEMLQKVLKIE